MRPPLDRREFLALGAAGLGASACAARHGPAPDPGPAPSRPAPAPPFTLSLAQWSLHRGFFGRGQPKLDPLDFARIARSFDLDAIEYVNVFYKERKTDRAAWSELKKRADGEGVQNVLIMCDGEGNLGDPDAARRAQAVANHHAWVELARHLGCHAIRVNAQSAGSWDEQQDRAADGLRQLCEFGARLEISVIVENHGGLSSNGRWLAGVMRKVDHPRCGTLPDFGNFRVSATETYDRYQGVTELMPYAKAVSAKSHDFDAAGDETATDYRRMLKIVHAAGYRGRIGIEYEGTRLSEADGIRATQRLLLRVRDELARG
jgi:sugar phosphate isomerase/epimerase